MEYAIKAINNPVRTIKNTIFPDNSDNGKNTDNSLEKDMDHIGDDIKDGVEDVGDDIKDGVDDLGGNEKNATGSSNTSGTAR